jgi:serine/threonine protein kinase
VHSRGILRDLNPDNILLDWSWNVRIADFGRSSSLDAPPLKPSDALSLGSHYFAPECYDGTFRYASDVFAFGLILFEIFVGGRAFPESLSQLQVVRIVAIDRERPEIPDSVLPPARELMDACWEADPDDRPTFEEIVDRLEEIRWKVTANVDSVKVAKFVKRIEEWENVRDDVAGEEILDWGDPND